MKVYGLWSEAEMDDCSYLRHVYRNQKDADRVCSEWNKWEQDKADRDDRELEAFYYVREHPFIE